MQNNNTLKDPTISSGNSFDHYLKIGLSFSVARVGLLIIRHPIHVVQINKQAFQHLTNREIVANIRQTNGFRGFYRSISTSVLKIGVTESYRGVLMIEAPKKIKASMLQHRTDYHPLVATLAASILATPLISIFDVTCTCPITRTATLQATMTNPSLKNVYETHFKGRLLSQLYRGYTLSLIQTSLLWGNFFIVDDLSKYMLNKYFGKVTYLGLALASITGGSITTCMNVIPDTIRVRMQTSNNSLNIRDTAKKLFLQHGVRAFFSALPHKFAAGIIGYGYKSALRYFWTKEESKH